jgi:polyhydroxyalkanoate synthase
VLASSGHIAGIINPPGGKGAFWTGVDGANTPSPEAWRESAERHEGSWWLDWEAWLADHSGRRQKPPSLGSDMHLALVDAPGTYVLER